MNIQELLHRLQEYQEAGATEVNIVDTHWNDYYIESIDTNSKGTEVILQVSLNEY